MNVACFQGAQPRVADFAAGGATSSLAARWHASRPAAHAGWRSRVAGLALVAGAHVALVSALLAYEPTREVLVQAMPIMVTLVTPAERQAVPIPKPAPAVQSVKPRVAPPRVDPQPTPLSTYRETSVPPVAAPTPEIAPPRAVVTPPPPIATAPAPTPAVAAAVPSPAPVVAAAVPSPAPVVAAPAPIVPPRFDAAYLDNPPPAYPPASRRLREQGRVVLRVLVTSGGTPQQVELRTSSGSPRLDDAARDTVKRWRFVPARQGSTEISAWVLVPISFSLEG